MAIIKVRTAIKKTQICAKCNRVIQLNEKYSDTDEKIGKRPWETRKLCSECQPLV